MQLALYAWTPPDVCAIPLRRKDGSTRSFAWVDADVFEQVGHLAWCLTPRGYVTRSAGGRKNPHALRLQRVVLGLEPGNPLHADHINGDKLDNRRCNLRAIEGRHNHQNLRPRKGGTSKYRGVSWAPHAKKWVAEAKPNGKKHHLGYFDDELEAARAAREFRRLHMPYSVEAA